jgi:energy-coupling factor transporter transmembrane protein EcfT
MNRVADDVAFGPENLGLPREEIGARVEFALRALGLEEIGGRLIEDLSPGQKQRVAIAGALAMRPHFLILDEPTSLLPTPVARRLISTVKDLNRREGMGVLHVTHSMSEAALFDRVIVMDAGRLVMDGTPAEVFRRVDELREVGLDVPLAASLAHRLRSRGVSLEGAILNEVDLRAAISAQEFSHGGPRPVTLDGEESIIELRNFRYTYLEGTPRANEAIRDVGYVLRGSQFFLGFLLFILFFQVLFYPGDVPELSYLWRWNFLSISTEGLRSAGVLGLRVIFLYYITTMLVLTTSLVDLTNGLELIFGALQRLKVPVNELVLVFVIAIEFVPIFIEEVERLACAQNAGGVPFDEGGAIMRARRLGRLLVPIFIGGFARADVLSTAMHTRCYRGGRYRTKLRRMHAEPSDWLMLALVVVWMIAAWQV